MVPRNEYEIESGTPPGPAQIYRFNREGSGFENDPYILSKTGEGYALISLVDGNRWTDPKRDIEDVFGTDGREAWELLDGEEITIKATT